MLRVKNISRENNKEKESKEKIAEYFGLDVSNVKFCQKPDVYTVDISGNEYAQEQYKRRNPFGNTKRPKVFDFTERQMVRWNGSKVQPLP